MGFNAGNGTKAYEYRPYSQTTQIRDLPSTGGANGFPGRHIFRIDEKILPGVCIRDLREWLLHLDCLQSIRIHRITKEKIKSTSPNGKVNPNNPLSSHQARPTCHWCSPPRTGTCWAVPWSTSPGPASCPAPGSPAGTSSLVSILLLLHRVVIVLTFHFHITTPTPRNRCNLQRTKIN